jgi:Dockerin type I domain
MSGLLARVSVVGFCTAATLHAQPITPQFRVNTNTPYGQGFPSVARLSTHGYVVVWATLEGNSLGVWGQRLSVSGSPIGSEFRVSSSTTGYFTHPAVASDDAGNFVVAWSGSKSHGNPGIFGRRFSSFGSPLDDDFRVNGNNTNETKFPDVAFDPTGSFFVVAWQLSDTQSASYGIFAHRYSSSGAALGGVFHVDTATTGVQFTPSVSASSGFFVVVWTDQSTTATSAFGRTYSADGTALLPNQVPLDAFTTAFQSPSDVVMLADDSFVVCWDGDGPGDGGGVFARRFNVNGAGLGASFRVNTYTTDSQSSGHIASDPLGHFVVVWTSHVEDGSYSGVFGQRLDGTGAFIGGEFRVNQNTTGAQDYAIVATSAVADDFLVVFRDDDVVGISSGIWARAYTLIGDANGDGMRDVADVFYLINALFASGPAPKVLSDVNHDGNVDVADVFYLINYLFAGGPEPG